MEQVLFKVISRIFFTKTNQGPWTFTDSITDSNVVLQFQDPITTVTVVLGHLTKSSGTRSRSTTHCFFSNAHKSTVMAACVCHLHRIKLSNFSLCGWTWATKNAPNASLFPLWLKSTVLICNIAAIHKYHQAVVSSLFAVADVILSIGSGSGLSTEDVGCTIGIPGLAFSDYQPLPDFM